MNERDELLAAVLRVGDELAGIRRVLECVVAGEAPAAVVPPADGGCDHPEHARVSMASPGNQDFFCRACEQMVPRPLAAAGA